MLIPGGWRANMSCPGYPKEAFMHIDFRSDAEGYQELLMIIKIIGNHNIQTNVDAFLWQARSFCQSLCHGDGPKTSLCHLAVACYRVLSHRSWICITMKVSFTRKTETLYRHHQHFGHWQILGLSTDPCTNVSLLQVVVCCHVVPRHLVVDEFSAHAITVLWTLASHFRMYSWYFQLSVFWK